MSREAIQMALHTLEGWANYGKWVWPESALEQAKRNTTESIAALRQALETEQKTAVSPGKGTGFNYFRSSSITVLRQPQEPVAWTPQVWRQFRPDGTLEFQKIKRTPNGEWEDYTSPPKRDLTCVCGAVWEGEMMVHPPSRGCGMSNLRQAAQSFVDCWDSGHFFTDHHAKRIRALRAALAEPEQEPVAWISEGGDVSRSKRYMDEMGFKCNPLYTAPPQREWVELTDEEIYATYDEAESLVNASWDNGFGTVGLMFPIAFYELLEAKLKERNG